MSEMIEDANAGPVIRYPGSKYSLARRVLEIMPRHERYIEPFSGSAAMLLAKPRSRVEMINDLDDELVNLYRVLRDRRQRAQLVEDVEFTPYAEGELRFVLGAAPSKDAVERARRYLVRSWFDIAGLRPHTAACFRLPGQKQSRIRPASVWSRLPERIEGVGNRIRDVEIRNTNAVKFIESQNSSDTLIYADPPYVWGTRQNQRYYHHEMSDAAHGRLLDALLAHAGSVLLSGYDTALYRDALEGRGWRRHEFRGRAQNRRPGVPPKKEIVWRNPAAVAACEDARVPLFEVE